MVVFKRRAEQLRAALGRSELNIVPGAGHMVHYQATEQVAEAVQAVADLSSRRDTSKAA
jgi:pimeloyl-ACP methyl ester carboxylesterase